MVVVVVTMIGIVLTAVGVLGAVYTGHLIARSPRFRARFRRSSFALIAGVYSVRRQLGYRLRRGGRMAGAWLRSVARRSIDGARAAASRARNGNLVSEPEDDTDDNRAAVAVAHPVGSVRMESVRR